MINNGERERGSERNDQQWLIMIIFFPQYSGWLVDWRVIFWDGEIVQLTANQTNHSWHLLIFINYYTTNKSARWRNNQYAFIYYFWFIFYLLIHTYKLEECRWTFFRTNLVPPVPCHWGPLDQRPGLKDPAGIGKEGAAVRCRMGGHVRGMRVMIKVLLVVNNKENNQQ